MKMGYGLQATGYGLEKDASASGSVLLRPVARRPKPVARKEERNG